jgi:hypothetical protein
MEYELIRIQLHSELGREPSYQEILDEAASRYEVFEELADLRDNIGEE